MKNITILALSMASILCLFSINSQANEQVKAEVYIISPQDGAVVSSPVTVVFGLKGMGVSPAGLEKAHTGHHHLLIDAPLPDLSKPLGKEVKHFGGGQTQTTLELAPGEHSLQLILADFKHQPHNPAVVSKKITITVK